MVPQYELAKTTPRFASLSQTGIMERELTRELVNTLLKPPRALFHCRYVIGPSGIGKSHALYASLVSLQARNHRIRIVYFPTCAEWIRAPFPAQYLINQFIATFVDDKEIHTALTTLKQETNMLAIEEFFGVDLMTMVTAAELEIIVVFDQINEIPESSLCTFPFSIIRSLSVNSTFTRGLLLVSLSASNSLANSEHFRIIRGWPHLTWNTGYTTTEFKAWRQKNKAFHDATKSELVELKHITACVPLELEILLAGQGTTTKDKLAEFESYRAQEFCKLTHAWVHELQKSQVARAAKAAVLMHFGLFAADALLDARFMFVADRKIVAITPLAERAIYSYWAANSVAETQIEEILSGTWPADVKGLIWKKRIIDGISAATSLVVEVEYLGKLKTKLKTKKQICVQHLQVVRFAGDSVPKPRPEYANQNLLLVPTSSNYPQVDFLIWDHYNKTLWAFQVTCEAKLREHTDAFFLPNKGRSQWEGHIQKTIPAITVNFVWVGQDTHTHPDWHDRSDYFAHIRAFCGVATLKDYCARTFGQQPVPSVTPPLPPPTQKKRCQHRTAKATQCTYSAKKCPHHKQEDELEASDESSEGESNEESAEVSERRIVEGRIQRIGCRRIG
eukprot:TRINITY_DN2199_c0_g1_i2.p1 TRINITY_DN2199_c0_g1~~TRINITY_DN2199_c0_g1_i2.p1  ORF type:complete len:679 (-),score=77.60 TRINITY_DN2199_c0_g1_i2:279-2135(-)